MPAILQSNTANIPFSDEYFKENTPFYWPADNFDQLQETYRRDGFVMIRGYLNRKEVLDLRRDYFNMFDKVLFKDGTAPVEGIYSGTYPNLPSHGVEGHPAHLFVRSSRFQRFANDPRLRGLAEILLGGSVVRLRRTPLRHFIKDRPSASRAHIDHTYLDRGSPNVVTFWIPIGDCPLETGGLVYLENSCELDLGKVRSSVPTDRDWDARPITHDLTSLVKRTGRRWLWADFQAGDVTAHSPFIVHASINTRTDRMRVSTDIRYALACGTLDDRWHQDWIASDGH